MRPWNSSTGHGQKPVASRGDQQRDAVAAERQRERDQRGRAADQRPRRRQAAQPPQEDGGVDRQEHVQRPEHPGREARPLEAIRVGEHHDHDRGGEDEDHPQHDPAGRPARGDREDQQRHERAEVDRADVAGVEGRRLPRPTSCPPELGKVSSSARPRRRPRTRPVTRSSRNPGLPSLRRELASCCTRRSRTTATACASRSTSRARSPREEAGMRGFDRRASASSAMLTWADRESFLKGSSQR